VSYNILRVSFIGPSNGLYAVPPGYKYADIFAAGGGGGGGCGGYIAAVSGTAVSGGGGGAHGVFGKREKVYVEGGYITYDLGAGGAGGYMDASGVPYAGQAGQGSIVSLQLGGTFVLLDCGYYINPQQFTGGQSGGTSSASGGTLSFGNLWVQNTQTGGSANVQSPGSTATSNTAYAFETYLSSGGGGGGVDSSGNLFDGGNVLDQNYILYSSGIPLEYQGKATGSSSTIDATASPGNFWPMTWGGAGGAASNISTSILEGSQRAGRGANGGYGSGGGGGGAMFDDQNIGSSTYIGGPGGNGGAGFLVMYLYK
jgi:hypothetical protein